GLSGRGQDGLLALPQSSVHPSPPGLHLDPRRPGGRIRFLIGRGRSRAPFRRPGRFARPRPSTDPQPILRNASMTRLRPFARPVPTSADHAEILRVARTEALEAIRDRKRLVDAYWAPTSTPPLGPPPDHPWAHRDLIYTAVTREGFEQLLERRL